ncbi:MAG: phage integrase N-terminal domain-containing protein [Panacagrimonas sp.]
MGSDLGGAHLTRDARAITFGTFVRVMRQPNFGIERAGQIGGRHLDAYVAKRM